MPMTRDPETGIRLLEGHIDYRDGSEARVLEVLRAASDRSSGSDELAAAVTDWPTRYHLSRLRSNLVRPLRLGPGPRILEVGAGTGAITRYLGETGAEVVALEGSLERARAASVRCSDLDNVEVVCGPLQELEDPDGFDLVCVVGVLEYAGSGVGGDDTHQAFLNRAASLIRDDGALVLAIENQIGVKYLLGYHEDHLGLPWVGLEGYGRGVGVRTFTRPALRAMLAAAGLADLRWYFPFPDYKLPTVVLSEQLYQLPQSPDLVDQLVRRPAGDSADRALLVDDRRAHRILVEAGIGPEVANSFLVLASPAGAELSFAPDPEILAWRLGDDRRDAWRRQLELARDQDGLRIRSSGHPGHRHDRAADWLIHDPVKDEPYRIGPTMEQMAIEACARSDQDALKDALCSWRWYLDQHAVPRVDRVVEHPFLGPDDDPHFPPEFVDVALSNFVLDDEGLHFIDREWQAPAGVAAHLVMVRALWLLAAHVIRSATHHPWSDHITVDQLAARLGELCEVDAGPRLLERVRLAEVELLHLVTGRDPAAIATDLEWMAGRSLLNSEVAGTLPFTRLEGRIDDLQTKLADLTARHQELMSASHRREHELNHDLGEARQTAELLRGELGVATEHLEGTSRELEAHRAELVAARSELEMWRDRQARFEERLPVRLLRALQRLGGG